MASEELHLSSTPEGDSNVNSSSSAAVTYVEDAIKALTIQSGSEKVDSNGSSCADIKETNLRESISEGKEVNDKTAQERENVLRQKEGQYNTIAEEKVDSDVNKYDNTETEVTSSDIKETNLRESISEDKEVSDKTAQERENVIRQKEDQYNTIAEEKVDSDVNKCESSYTSSNSEETGNQNSNSVQVVNTEKELLKEELKLLQCPFTWNLNFRNARTTTEKVIANCNDKLKSLQEENDEDEDDDVEEGFEWRKFILSLILCHEHSISGSSSEALSKILECENLIDKCQSNKKPDAFFQNIKEALLHVLHSTKCHVLVSLNMFSDAVKLKHNISRYENMSRQNMAAIFGMQSSMLMEYGFEGTKAALEYVQKAVDLDGNEAEWHFLYGKILGRIRRVENYTEIPTQVELSALEQAVRIRKNSSRIVFLAQAYREAATKAFVKNRNNIDSLKDILTNMNEKSLQLYWEALDLNGNSVRVNIRCAAGLLKLPPPFRNLKKAEECIEKALKLAPDNTMANHVAGNLYEKLSKFDLAEKFYKRAGEMGAYGAYMNLLTMKINKDNKYDPLPELEEMLHQFTEEARLQETYLQMGSYRFYFKNDTLEALDYWMKGIELNPNAEKLKTHKCSFLVMKAPVNLYQVIVDETRLALEQNNFTDENILKLRKMLLYCTEKYPELLTNKPQSWRRHPKEQNSQGRRKNQTNGRGAGQWHGDKHPKQWRNESREDGKSFRSNSSTTRRDNYQNKDHTQLQQHENWRSNPKDVQFSDQADSMSTVKNETCDSLKESTDSMGNVENASASTEDSQENFRSKKYWSQQRRGTNKGFTGGRKWQSSAQEEYQGQQSHCRGSWRNKDYRSYSLQRVHQNEIQHGRRKNEENEFEKCEPSEKH